MKILNINKQITSCDECVFAKHDGISYCSYRNMREFEEPTTQIQSWCELPNKETPNEKQKIFIMLEYENNILTEVSIFYSIEKLTEAYSQLEYMDEPYPELNIEKIKSLKNDYPYNTSHEMDSNYTITILKKYVEV